MGTLLLKQFQKPDVLNIFCDASVRREGKGNYTGCYGAVAVIGDDLFDQIYRISSNTTNNQCEVKGLRAAVDMALIYRNYFRVLNIFCDSEVSVIGARDWILNWSIDGGTMYSKQGTPVKSQEIFCEIAYSVLRYNTNINLWHQKGHVSFKGKGLVEADHTFICSNKIRTKVDINLIRYISRWNDTVDKQSRSILATFNHDKEYTDPIYFFPKEFDVRHYGELVDPNRGVL